MLGALGITSPVAGDLYTIAGNGTLGSTGDGQLATNSAVEIGAGAGIAVDTNGNIYVATQNQNAFDYNGGTNGRVRRIDGTTGVITTFVDSAGTIPSTNAANGDGGTAANAGLFGPCGIALDANGDLYIADSSDYRVRMVAH